MIIIYKNILYTKDTNLKTYFSYSVIIPTYDRPNLLLRALKSVNKQTIKPKEVFIVDNHPFYKSKIIYHKAKNLFKFNINYLKIHPRKGATASRNYASKLSTSKYLAFLDDDDFWEKKYIQKVSEKFHETKSKLNITEYNVVEINKKKKFYFHIPEQIELQELYKWNPGILCSNMVIDKDAFFKIKGFDEKILGSGDKDILIKCIKKKIKYSILKKGLVNWTSHNNQWSQNYSLILKGLIQFHMKYSKDMSLFSKIISIKKILKFKLKTIS